MLSYIIHNVNGILGVVIILFTAFIFDSGKEVRVWVAPESEVVIKGTTNVNVFACQYNVEGLEVPVYMTYEKELIHFKNARLELANDCFDCGGKAINKDFRDLLKTEHHPQVELRLLRVDLPKSDGQEIGASVEVIIAGIARKYEAKLNCILGRDICVNGTMDLSLSDFGLEPPRKVLGMIKVDDRIKVKIALVLKEI